MDGIEARETHPTHGVETDAAAGFSTTEAKPCSSTAEAATDASS